MSADVYTIVCQFDEAAAKLATTAKDWRAGQFRRSDMTDAANIIEGLRALLVELRRGQAPQ